jgi:thiamine pyrophosphokinase
MRPAVLVAPIAQSVPVWDADYVGIDAGVTKILERGLTPVFACGDFDSGSVPKGITIYQHPRHKNETDTQLAIEKCLEMGYRQITVWGALSKRLDHTIANIRLIMYKYPMVVLEDSFQKVQVFGPGEHVIDKSYRHISFFAVQSCIVSLEGFEYPLKDRLLEPEDIYTVSNSIEGKAGTLKIVRGQVLCVQTNYI